MACQIQVTLLTRAQIQLSVTLIAHLMKATGANWDGEIVEIVHGD
jgi:hypothetical protein